MDGVIRITAHAGTSTYDILVGASILAKTFECGAVSSAESIAIIVSSRVYEIHRDRIESAYNSLRSKCHLFLMDDGENNKNYAYAEQFLNHFIEKKLNRKSIVVGIGGGVVGDFAGYCAGVYMRGIPVVHVPTTLLSMVDSSIGGKVAVNLSVGKNIVGLFYQPLLVVSDISFLETLPDDEFKNGYAEAIKHGLIGDTDTLQLMESNDPISIKRMEIISRLVSQSVLFKSKIVASDEREKGLRAILNFGHTVGHAIESYREYKGVSHGEAVAMGMRIKVEISRRMGLLTDSDASLANHLIDKYGLRKINPDLDLDAVIGHMAYDKKNFGGSINFVLLNGLGTPMINQQISLDMLKKVLEEII